MTEEPMESVEVPTEEPMESVEVPTVDVTWFCKKHGEIVPIEKAGRKLCPTCQRFVGKELHHKKTSRREGGGEPRAVLPKVKIDFQSFAGTSEMGYNMMRKVNSPHLCLSQMFRLIIHFYAHSTRSQIRLAVPTVIPKVKSHQPTR